MPLIEVRTVVLMEIKVRTVVVVVVGDYAAFLYLAFKKLAMICLNYAMCTFTPL